MHLFKYIENSKDKNGNVSAGGKEISFFPSNLNSPKSSFDFFSL